MKSTCQLGDDGNCTQCGKPVAEKLHRECSAKKRSPAPKQQLPGIGDLTKEFFGALGITEERYKAVKETLHLEPTCKCAARQEWLNAMGDELGITGVANRFAGWLVKRRTSAN